MKRLLDLFKRKHKSISATQEIMTMRDLTNIQSAVARAVNAIKDLVAACAAKDAEIASLQAQAVADAAVIADLTAQLEAAIPDLGGSMGGVA